jgi:hypothetical protein
MVRQQAVDGDDGLVDLKRRMDVHTIAWQLQYPACVCLGTGVRVWQVKRRACGCAKIDLEFNVRGDLHVAF